MKGKLTSIYKLLFQLFVFLIPTQLAYHFWPTWSHVFGIRIDYLSPTIYLTDILFLSLLLIKVSFSSFKFKPIKKGIFFISLFFFFVVLNILLGTSTYLPAFKWLKIFEFILLAILIKNEEKLDVKTWILLPLAASLGFFSLIGIIQFILGHTIGGIFYFLGERTFNLVTPGISHVIFSGREYLRPYSTFPHPNSMAGFLAVSLIMIGLLLRTRDKKEKIIKATSLLLGGIALVLTFSLGAFLSLFIVGIYYLISRKSKKLFERIIFATLFLITTLSLFLPIISERIIEREKGLSENIYQRLVLAVNGGRAFSESPVVGIGINNFIVWLSKATLPGGIWLLQPVHNIFFLILVETGLVGFLLFLFLLFKSFKKLIRAEERGLLLAFVIVLISGFFDHYWVTLQQNQLLLSLLFGLSLRRNRLLFRRKNV